MEECYVKISSEDALKILKKAYSVLEAKEDGNCNRYEEIESVFLFSLSERIGNNEDDIALIVRRGRKLGKFKRNGTMYQDAPDDGNNEGSIAKKLRSKMPVLVLTEQINQEWGVERFWWPIYYTPNTMNIGLYSEEKPKTGVYENINNACVVPMYVDCYHVVDHIGISKNLITSLENAVNDISEYYTINFDIKRSINSKRKKKIECPVYVDSQEVFSNDDSLIIYINKVKNKVINILKKLENRQNLIEKIFVYFDLLVEKKADDEEREWIIQTIEELGISKTQKLSLLGMIDEADEIAKNREEI